MSRQMPEYCEHGTLVCAGDFANPEDVQECPLCHIESLPFKMAAKDKRIAELEGMIVAFCHKQRYAHDMWKNEPHIKPLFDTAALLGGGDEA